MKLLDVLKKLFIIGLLVGFASCGSEEESSEPTLPQEEDAVITCLTTELNFDSVGGEQSFSMTVNKDWSIKVADGISWCALSLSEGKAGEHSVRVKVDENTTYIERNVTLFIKCGEISHCIVVVQKQLDAILLNSEKVEVGSEGGTIQIGVKANVEYGIEIAEESKGWIKDSSSRSLTAYSHTFTISPNETSEQRRGIISFKYGDQCENVEVFQEGTGSVLLLTQKEYFVSAAGETIKVELKSNVEYEMEMPNVDWLSLSGDGRGVSSHTLNFIILPNDTYDERKASVVFYDKNSDLKEILVITQGQKNGLSLVDKEIVVEQEGGQIAVSVNANVDYQIVIPEVAKEWIVEYESRMLDMRKHIFIVSPNEGFDERSAEILFKNDVYGLEDKLFVSQRQKDLLSVSKKQYEVESSQTTIEVEVISNIDYEVRIEGEWIQQVEKSRAVQNEKLRFLISENTLSQERVGKIIVSNGVKSMAQEIIVRQKSVEEQGSQDDKNPEGKLDDMNWGEFN